MPDPRGRLTSRIVVASAWVGVGEVRSVLSEVPSAAGRQALSFEGLAVAWQPKNAQIPLTDPTTSEIEVTSRKVAGLTQISNEAPQDPNPAVSDQVGRSLACCVAKKVDAAFFANTTANGPLGLLSAAGVNVVDTGAISVLTNVDVFHDSKAAALEDRANLTVFILAPDVALQLAKTKEGSASIKSLFENVGDGVNLELPRVFFRSL